MLIPVSLCPFKVAAVGSGAEARAAELSSRLREAEGKLQAAVGAEKAASRQLAAISQVWTMPEYGKSEH